MPQPASDAGIGCALSHAPLAYVKKSSPGLTERSMLADRKSCFGEMFSGGVVVVLLPQPTTVRAAAATRARRRKRRMITGGPFNRPDAEASDAIVRIDQA